MEPVSKYASAAGDYGPVKLAFWYSAGWTKKLGRLKEEDLRAADNTDNTAGVLPVRFLLSCSSLWGNETYLDGSKCYWGFGNTWGNFGKTHGSIAVYQGWGNNSGGSYMFIMGLEGGVRRVNAKPFPAVAQ